MLHTIARSLALLWLTSSKNSWRNLPRPTDAPIVHAPGVDPDRVLFVGSGAVVGYGVLSYGLSISGEIARQASQITDRGMDGDIVADSSLDISSAVEAFETIRVARYDAVVLLLGSYEVMTLYPLRRWRANLERLLDRLAAEAPASLRVVVVGVPPFEKIVHLPFLSLFAKRCRDLNDVTEEVIAERSNVTFAPLDPDAEDLVKNAGRALHVRWATLIAPFLAAVLTTAAPARTEVVNEDARVAALQRLQILDSAPDDNIQDIVDSARGLFDASGASFNLIDRERHWVKAASGISKEPAEMPRSESFCAITVEQSRLFVIEDMTKDVRYSEKPFVTGPPGLRFYAGYPVEAPNGERVGSLCIIDTKARTFSKAEAMLLRDLALRVQSMVWDRVGARPARLDH